MAYNITAVLNFRADQAGLTRVVDQVQAAVGSVKGTLDFRVTPGAARSAADLAGQLGRVREAAAGAGAAAGIAAASLDRTGAAASKAAAAARASAAAFGDAGTAAERFGQTTSLAAKRFLSFQAGAGAISAFTGAVRGSIREAAQFDLRLNKLRQVTDEGAGAVAGLRAEIGRLATAYGVASGDLADAAVSLTQAGVSATKTRGALEALAQSALAPNFDSLTQTVEGSIAVLSQFDKNTENLKRNLGAMNAVAGAFAVEASDLITAVQKSGGAFAAAGGNLDEFLGVMTAVRATTRESAAEISTGIRTIFQRLQRTETADGLKALGIELRRTRAEAEALGDVSLTDQLVPPLEAVRRVSEGLAKVRPTDPRFAEATELIGGYRQISRVLPLVQEFATAQKAVNVARAGGASLEAAAATRQDAFLTKLTKVQETYQKLANDLADSRGVRSLVDAFSSGAEAAARLVKAVEPLAPALAAIGLTKLASGAGQFAGGLLSPSSYSPASTLRRRFAAGGPVAGGQPGKDSVLSLLMPGEFVLKADAVRKLGVERLRFMNDRGELPAFAAGGGFDLPASENKRLQTLARLPQIQADPARLALFNSLFADLDSILGRLAGKSSVVRAALANPAVGPSGVYDAGTLSLIKTLADPKVRTDNQRELVAYLGKGIEQRLLDQSKSGAARVARMAAAGGPDALPFVADPRAAAEVADDPAVVTAGRPGSVVNPRALMGTVETPAGRLARMRAAAGLTPPPVAPPPPASEDPAGPAGPYPGSRRRVSAVNPGNLTDTLLGAGLSRSQAADLSRQVTEAADAMGRLGEYARGTRVALVETLAGTARLVGFRDARPGVTPGSSGFESQDLGPGRLPLPAAVYGLLPAGRPTVTPDATAGRLPPGYAVGPITAAPNRIAFGRPTALPDAYSLADDGLPGPLSTYPLATTAADRRAALRQELRDRRFAQSLRGDELAGLSEYARAIQPAGGGGPALTANLGASSLATARATDDLDRRGLSGYANLFQGDAKERAGERVRKQLERGIARQLAATDPRLNRADRRATASLLADDALANDRAVLRDGSGRVLGLGSLGEQLSALRAGGGTTVDDAGRGRVGRLLDRVRGSGRVGGFVANQLDGRGGTLAAGVGIGAAAYLSDAVGPDGGFAQRVAAGTGSEFGYYGRAGGAGFFQGAAVGAGVGLVAGPFGAAVGAVVGGLGGLATSLTQAGRDIEAAKVGLAVTRLGDALAPVAAGKAGLNEVKPTLLADVRAGRRAAEGEGDRDAGGSFLYRQLFDADPNEIAAARGQRLRQAFGNNVGSVVGALTGEAQRLAKASPGQSDRQILQQLQQGLPGELLKLTADVRGVPLADVLKETASDIKEFRQNLRVQGELKAARDASDRTATTFGRLSQAVEAAAAAAGRFDGALSTSAAAFGGGGAVRVGGVDPALLARPGTLSDADYARAAAPLAGRFGADGDALLAQAQAANRVGAALPSVLADLAAGEGDASATTSENARRRLTQLFDKDPTTGGAISRVVAGIAEADAKENGSFLQSVRGDSTQAAAALLEKLRDAPDALARLAEQARSAGNSLIDGLSQSRRFAEQAGAEQDGVGDAGLRLARTRADRRADRLGGVNPAALLGLGELTGPLDARQRRLAGGIGLDPDAIGRRLAVLPGRLDAAREARDAAVGTDAFAGLAAAFDALQGEQQNLIQALKNLADPTARLAAVNEKLSVATADRDSRLGFAERFIQADPNERFQLARGQALVARLATAGPDGAGDQFRRLNVDDQRLALQGAQLVGQSRFANGLTGESLRRLLLESTGIVPNALAGEIGGLQGGREQEAERAAAAQGELAAVLTASNSKFLTDLLAAQKAFLGELDVQAKQGALDRAGNRVAALAGQTPALKAQQEQAALLAKAGVTTDDQLGKARAQSKDLGDFFANLGAAEAVVAGGRLDAAGLSKRFREQGGDGFGGASTRDRLDQAGLLDGLSDPEKVRTVRDIEAAVNGGAKLDATAGAAVAAANERRLRQLGRERGEVAGRVNQGAVKADQALGVPAADRTGFLKALDAFKGESLNDLPARLKSHGEESAKAAAAVKALAGEMDALRKALPVAPGQQPQGLAAGGLVRFTPKGTDTVPAMLTPGEMVVNRESARANRALLERINAARGPHDIPNELDDLAHARPSYLAAGGIVPNTPYGTRLAGGVSGRLLDFGVPAALADRAGREAVRRYGDAAEGEAFARRYAAAVLSSAAARGQLGSLIEAQLFARVDDFAGDAEIFGGGAERMREQAARGQRRSDTQTAGLFARVGEDRLAAVRERIDRLEAVERDARVADQARAINRGRFGVGNPLTPIGRNGFAFAGRFAAGGPVPGGGGGGDNVLALLQGGEYVLNREQARAIRTGQPSPASPPGANQLEAGDFGERAKELAAALGQFAQPGERLASALVGFGTTSERLSSALEAFPQSVTHEGRFDVNVSVTGPELWAAMQKPVEEFVNKKVMAAVKAELDDAFPDLPRRPNGTPRR